MGLNKSTGNMYQFVTHTWNTVKGACPHDCSYCYMKRWGALNPMRFDEKELKTDLGHDNFIFVGSSCDMWANTIPEEWIIETLKHCDKFDNRYLFQTKNPANIRRVLPAESIVCVTLESNRYYSNVMRYSPRPGQRIGHMKYIRHPLYITIEPIMDFDLDTFASMLEETGPQQVNIGADSGGHNLPEPPQWKIEALVNRLEKFTDIRLKKNLNRLIK
jgi:DNA repair photolyase